MTSTDLVFSPAVMARLDVVAQAYDARAAALVLADPDARRDPVALELQREARAESTRLAYLRWIGIYIDFCDRTQRRERPAHASTLEAFAAYLTTRPVERGKNKGRIGFAPNTIRQAISAVRTYHALMGEDRPDLGLASSAVGAHARRRSKEPGSSDGKGAPGLRLPSLRRMFEECDPTTNAGARDRAVLAMGWAMMARRSELSALNVEDVELVEEGVRIIVRRSKTDQLGAGAKVPLGWRPDLAEMCPVVCITRWHEIMAALGFTTGPFFRGVDRHDRINGQPGWCGPKTTTSRLDPATVELIISRAALRASVPDAAKLTGHSLRRGGATDFYVGGADILAIARHGRWGERSPVIFRYIEDVDRWKTNPLAVANFDDNRDRRAERREL